MAETLYLFVTSERPDQYLNPILHCLQHMNLNKIVFLYVEYGAEDENNLVTSAKSIRQNVESFLSALTEGKYKYFIGNLGSIRIYLILLKSYCMSSLPTALFS